MSRVVMFCLASIFVSLPVVGQVSQRTNIKGNTEINATTKNMTAIAAGQGNVAKNRVGVVQGEKRGDTKINVVTENITTIAVGRNRKACTNIGGVVSDECK